jgi:transposase-like protein
LLILFFACFIVLEIPLFAQKVIPDQSVLTASLSGVNVTEKAVQNITAYNHIRSGYVKYVAGRSIHLKPGFHVANGANFQAKIEPVEQDDNKLIPLK